MKKKKKRDFWMLRQREAGEKDQRRSSAQQERARDLKVGCFPVFLLHPVWQRWLNDVYMSNVCFMAIQIICSHIENKLAE